MNLECDDGTNTISAQHSLTAPPPPAKTIRVGDRVKLACSSCRRDNKKCDDQRPCSRCIARSQECIQATRVPKLVKLRCEGCRADNRQCEESRPCKPCLESARECITLPRKGRGQGGRVKAACMACRRDKIRCDGDRPCTSCVKKGCPCVERPCQTCLQEGTADGDCNHRRRAGGSISDAVKETVIHTEPFYQRVLGPFHPPQSADQLEESSPRPPQWALFAPGPHSHPLHPMYPTLIPQPQYYFPPQPLPGHLIQLPFPMMPNSTFIPGPSSQPSMPYNEPQVVPEIYPMLASSSNHIPE
ncbi:hypothetical protein M413DRAFT_442637 [Hebeloma cylindrosporum]|uniref:Transcription activator of gluconeogenesis ERT1 n=1 Tax=Hebeloma cylindrosporum TaxID=76867 RepID=A0A0C2Y4C1_HEBCY|nr:hypothetical protein M413DRAFT_442637 [Hebeloma cylindrosporum h7]